MKRSRTSRSHRRHRRRLVRLTVVGVVFGAFISMYLITEVYVLGTDRPVSAPPGLSYVQTGSYRTRFETWGVPSSSPIVLLHGAFESADTWTAVAHHLAVSHHVEAYDLEGYGYTQRVGPYTTQSMARQLFQFLRSRHLVHPILVGHSLGAGVIAQFVLDHPHDAAGIIFLDGDGLSVSYPGRSIEKIIPEPFRSALYRIIVRSDFVIRTAWRLACGPQCRTLTARQLAALQRPLEVAGAQQALFTIASRPIVGLRAQQLAHIALWHVPALVIFGRNDPEYASDAALKTARTLGAPSPTLIAGAGHLTLVSNPGQVAAAIASFAAKVAALG